MVGCMFFFFKQKSAYEMRISDWSSDVCSSDLNAAACLLRGGRPTRTDPDSMPRLVHDMDKYCVLRRRLRPRLPRRYPRAHSYGEEIERASDRERFGQYV